MLTEVIRVTLSRRDRGGDRPDLPLGLSGTDADGWDDDMLRAAVLQQLTTIGEASRSVDNQLQEQYPEIPWRRIADFRNVAVHEYFSVDWSLVWRLVQDRLPMLRPRSSR
jgi:uncharacterized protein with HEPN domain